MTTTQLKNARTLSPRFIGRPKIEPPFDQLPPDAQRVRLWAVVQPKSFAEGDDYLAEISAKVYAQSQSNGRHPLGDIPLIVLARSRSDYPADVSAVLTAEHNAQQAKFATLSTNGVEIVVPNPDIISSSMRRTQLWMPFGASSIVHVGRFCLAIRRCRRRAAATLGAEGLGR